MKQHPRFRDASASRDRLDPHIRVSQHLRTSRRASYPKVTDCEDLQGSALPAGIYIYIYVYTYYNKCNTNQHKTLIILNPFFEHMGFERSFFWGRGLLEMYFGMFGVFCVIKYFLNAFIRLNCVVLEELPSSKNN